MAAFPSGPMGPQGAPPGPAPLPAPAGAPPPSAQGGPPPAGGPPKPPTPGGGQMIQMLLAFLAGAGLDKVVASIGKITQPAGSGAARAHRGGVRMEAAQNPGMTVAPQMAQQMAQGGQGGGQLPMPPGGGGGDPTAMAQAAGKAAAGSPIIPQLIATLLGRSGG